MNIFEQASRKKLRFAYRGAATVEDLWDLTPEQLNQIYTVLRREVNETTGESLLDQPSRKTETLVLSADVVKHIFAVKQAETAAREQVAENHLRKQRILEIIQTKQDQALYDLPVDELQQLVSELG